MIRKQKYKRSRQREKILSILRSTDTHPTAGWIYDQLKNDFPNLSMGTVYRNINILLDQKLIQKIEAGSRFDRYDANTDTHYHFFCQECGCVDDLPLDVSAELESKAQSLVGYKVDKHRLDFYGSCPGCNEDSRQQAYAGNLN